MTIKHTTQDKSVDYKLKWYVMAAVAMGVFLGTIDGSIVNVALPTLVRELNTDFPTVQWVVLGYLLAQATLMLSVGRMGDMVGKKPVYTIGFVVFTLGSVMCGLAPNVHLLIAFRIFQAIGASMTAALGMAIVTEAFPPNERGKALGIMGTIVSVGIAVGPTIGGMILGVFSWHWIFFVNLPIGIIGIFMVIRFVPNFKPEGRQKFDFLGAGAMLVSLLSLLLALTLGQSLGFGNTFILVLFGTFVLFLGIFIALELRIKQPMIDLRLFRNTLFSINLVTGVMAFIALSGTTILIPFYLENVLGFNPQKVGLLMATIPVFLGVIAPISGSLSDRFGTRPITLIGLAVLMGGYFLMSTITADTTVLGYILRILPIGLGIGIFQSPNNSAVMGTVPRERLGVASGLLSLSRTLGQTTGIAAVGAFWAARVFFHNGSGLPGGATDAPAAAQVSGLHDTFVILVGLMLVAFSLAAYAVWEERRKKTGPILVGEHGE
ncbi:MAG: MFS transporter [Anaerolineales bacterium]|nr:MFS transporter [Anaerolineales bacterium]